MSDISEFLQSYGETLREEIAGADMPPELTERFIFDSCVKRKDGREVYFVTQRSDGLRAVLRVTDGQDGENAAAEYAILKKLDHPAIPKALGAWEHKGRGYLAREYFSGDDLHTHTLKYGPLSFETLAGIALQVCDILTYIHSQNPAIIHRDIKPENIIISGKNEVKLIDFGIARSMRQETDSLEHDSDTSIAGTRPYMAPEQFGSDQTDSRADIYALGVVMIFMATGKPDKLRLKADYPYKGLVPLIEKCIRTDRDRRYSTAARLKRRILWVYRGGTRKTLLCAGVCAAVSAAFLAGLFAGRAQGFRGGVMSIMDTPAAVRRPFTQEELRETISFRSDYIERAVRLALNQDDTAALARGMVSSHVQALRIYGTYIIHPSLDISLLKTHLGKDEVVYSTSDGFRPDRGDISSLEDIPNMYYLRSLSLALQAISDLSPLSGMKLESIDVSGNYVGNLLPLKDMVTLRELGLCQNPLKDLTPLSRLLSLERLDISQTQVRDLLPLAELTKLKKLDMAYCDIKDISVLAKLPNLREVDLSHTLVTDLSPLVRPDNPITVRCAGLAKEVIDAVRGMAGIVVVEG